MISLIQGHDWGHRSIRKVKRSVQSKITRPAFEYQFNPVHGVSRSKVKDWPIEGFAKQDLEIDMSAIASWAKRPLTTIETDWINLALAIYSADRFSSRRPNASSGDSFWKRSISLEVAVADPSFWNSIQPEILHALRFLTDDNWNLEFALRKELLEEESQMHFHDEISERPAWVCLFSGGLDSLAGFNRLSNEINGKGLIVSGWTNERLKVGQEKLVSKIPSARGSSFDWLQVYYGFPMIKNSHLMESSQRSRGWIHVALGLLALAVSGQDVLDVCENGIGAMNLPTEFSQTGSHTSRAVHPVFLNRMAKVASLVFGKKLQIRQSALFETKAELLRQTLSTSDAELINDSFSCEIFPNFNAKQSQCGVCPSCLVRRAALRSADLPDSGEQYSHDVLSSHLPAKQALGMIKMRRYVQRIESCFNDTAMPDAALWEYPEAGSYFEEAALSLGLSLDEFLINMRRLHQSFALEWKDFSGKLPSMQTTYPITN